MLRFSGFLFGFYLGFSGWFWRSGFWILLHFFLSSQLLPLSCIPIGPWPISESRWSQGRRVSQLGSHFCSVLNIITKQCDRMDFLFSIFGTQKRFWVTLPISRRSSSHIFWFFFIFSCQQTTNIVNRLIIRQSFGTEYHRWRQGLSSEELGYITFRNTLLTPERQTVFYTH